MHNTEIVYAIHDFVAENEDEIAFNAGESIIVLEKDEKYMDGWWQGRNTKGQVGLFPMNYTTAVKPPSTSTTTDSSPPTSDSSRATSNVLLQHDEDRFTLENEIDNAISHVNSSMISSSQPPPPQQQPPASAPPLPPPSGSPPSLPPALIPSSTSSTTNPEDWNIDQVAEWLKSVGLGNVSNIFIEQEITGDVLMDLTTDSLKELGINAYGRRYKIMAAIEKLKSQENARPITLQIQQQQQQQHDVSSSSSPPVSPVDGSSMYQFPRKAPAPPRLTDSMLSSGQLSPNSFGSATVSRSNTFQTISSKVSSSSSSNGGGSGSGGGNSFDRYSESRPSTSRQTSFEISDSNRPFSNAGSGMASIRENETTSTVHPMDKLTGGNHGFSQTMSIAEPALPLPQRDRNMSVASVEATGLSRSSSNAFKAPEHEGWLHKQGDKYKTWNKRWFVLKGSNLFYFKSPKDVRMRGIIHLRGYRVVVDESIHAGKYSFKAQHDRERTFYFYTDTKESLRTWINVLMKATISRDFTSPVMSSNHVATVPLDIAQKMRPRPPSMLLSGNKFPPNVSSVAAAAALATTTTQDDMPQSSQPSLKPPSPLPDQQTRESGITVYPHHHAPSSVSESQSSDDHEKYTYDHMLLSDEDEDLIDPMHSTKSTETATSSSRRMNRKQYIDWINAYLPSGKRVIDLSGAFRNGDTLIMLLESLSQKTVRRSPAQKGGSVNMQMLDNIVAAFKFMGREGVVVDGRFTIKDIFGGDESKIMDMLDAIMDWADKNGFNTATV